MSYPQPLTPRLDRLRDRLASHRPWTDPDAEALRWAAVAVVLKPAPDAVLLIRRAERVGDPWSGHMALPGGRREPGDDDLVATAIRETSEEVGLPLSRGQLLGVLDDVVPRTPVLPPIAIRPCVFLLHAQLPLTLNPEVAGARWVELDRLLHPGTRHPVRLEIRGESREVDAYQLDDAIVWGLTERVLSGLLRHLGG
ncbi:MAG TPA: CoA pyrophosphatase [Gemmatimonadales bacterium]|jgi:8-oxo-dGTP pyrophosphatase MutT (NUDIX family)|nr:CoA pyrophosphatase [Gemmatimonadales bacterium]